MTQALGPCSSTVNAAALIAMVQAARGELDEAEQGYRAAIPAATPEDRLPMMLRLTQLLIVRDRTADAAQVLEQADALRPTLASETPALRLEWLLTRAKLDLARGDFNGAVAAARDGYAVAETQIRNVRTVSTESRLEAFMPAQDEVARLSWDLARRSPHDPLALRQGLEAALLWKGRLLDEATLAVGAARDLRDEHDRTRFETLRSLRRRVAALTLFNTHAGGGVGASSESSEQLQA